MFRCNISINDKGGDCWNYCHRFQRINDVINDILRHGNTHKISKKEWARKEASMEDKKISNEIEKGQLELIMRDVNAGMNGRDGGVIDSRTLEKKGGLNMPNIKIPMVLSQGQVNPISL